MARDIVSEIQAEGKLPIIEGGSFFYAKHIFDDIRKADAEDDGLYTQSKTLAN